MKRIVICLDGTWNQVRTPSRVTNVVKIAQAVRTVASDGRQQVVYYNSGVGTGDLIDKVLGGILGRGLRANVKRAYAFLSLNYEPDDEIYIFGFSRGAYTARALAGVIGKSGILKKSFYEQFEVAWKNYRSAPKLLNLEEVAAKLPKPVIVYRKYAAEGKFHTDVKVRCVGVWDTVGSYGVPAGFGLAATTRILTAWLLNGFCDTEIGAHIEIGLHAVALDEKRRPFAPTFWTVEKGKQPAGHVEQVWFVGAHANIGGSYGNTGLSDIALLWMCSRVAEIGQQKFASALEFDQGFLKQHAKPSALEGVYHHSEWGWPISTVFPYHRPVLAPNAVKVNVMWNGEDPKHVHINEMIHWSVKERFGKPAPVFLAGRRIYRPKNLKEIPNDRVTTPSGLDSP